MDTTTQETRHGAITDPPSRATLNLPEEWMANGLEAGKFFPKTEAGLRDEFAPDDEPNDPPPEDGKIASAGKPFANQLDQVGSDWTMHPVTRGEPLTFSWTFHAEHKTRRYNYFLTRWDWDPDQPLSRDQFHPEPVHMVQLGCQPYWSCSDLMPTNPTKHTFYLPDRPPGHHVLLAVWEVADTAMGFYQVIDLAYSKA